MIRAVFFDYDGVLTTDKTGTYTTCRYLNEVTGIDIDRLHQCYTGFNSVLNTGKKLHRDIWPSFCRCIGQDIDIRLLRDAFYSTPSNDDVMDLAKLLGERYKIGIITDNKEERMDAVTERFGLDKIFDSIIISARVGYRKDDERIFFAAAKSIMIKPERCVYIDNQEKNLMIPRRLGFKTIFYDHEKNDFIRLKKQLQDLGVRI